LSGPGGTFAGEVDTPAPGAGAGDPVVLTDLEVITRYSLALRAGSAEREELIGVLRDDLEWLTATAPGRSPAPARPPEPGHPPEPARPPEPPRVRETAPTPARPARPARRRAVPARREAP
jgi:hypothetical protein